MKLFHLHLRRGLRPGLGLCLIGLAVLVHLAGTPSQVVGLGSGKAAAALRGLQRADMLMGMLSLLIPLSCMQVARTWRTWERRERYWLVTSPRSKLAIILQTWAGGLCASWLWLGLVTGLCVALIEHDGHEEWRVEGSLELQNPQRVGGQGRLSWTCNVPQSDRPQRAHFEVGLYGAEMNIDEFVFSSFGGPQREVFDSDHAQAARISILEVNLPNQAGPVEFELHAVGAQNSMLLHRPRLQLLVASPAQQPLILFALRVGLLLAAAHAILLGLCAWFSAGTALTYVFGAYLLIWLESERWSATAFGTWVPGFDLPQALQWIGEGLGPGLVAPTSWLGCVVLICLGLGSSVIAMGRWRAGR